MKACGICGVEKPVSEYYSHPQTADRLQGCCKSCHRSGVYRRRYGITVEDFDSMLEAQGGVCAICGGTDTKGNFLHVDHNHKTGKVRGLLCDSCNNGIGRFEDDPERLLAAAAYLIQKEMANTDA